MSVVLQDSSLNNGLYEALKTLGLYVVQVDVSVGNKPYLMVSKYDIEDNGIVTHS